MIRMVAVVGVRHGHEQVQDSTVRLKVLLAQEAGRKIELGG